MTNIQAMLKGVRLHITERVTFEQRIGGFAETPRVARFAEGHNVIRDEFRDEFALSGCIDAPDTMRLLCK